jgi:hypothetical protein
VSVISRPINVRKSTGSGLRCSATTEMRARGRAFAMMSPITDGAPDASM